MRTLLFDLRLAARTLTRSPWFAGLAVLILTLGIGANTALFSLLDAVLLRALPYADPDRLVTIWSQDGERAGMRVPIPLVEAIRERSATVEAISIHNAEGGALRTPEGPVSISGQRVSANFVELMGVLPLAGRGFLPEDGNPGAAAVLVATFSFWQQRLGGDPEAVGSSIYLDEVPYTVVGIMPPEFRSYLSNRNDFWTPYRDDRAREVERKRGHELQARLSSGITIADARRELNAIAKSVGGAEWSSQGKSIGVQAMKAEVVGGSAYPLQLLLAAVGVVLLIACANLAQLLLARSDRRMSEFATRKALGAPSSRLFRLALMESILLSAAGGVGGVVLAYWLLPSMMALAPSEIPRIAEAAIDGRVLAATLGLTVLTSCAFGFAPALKLSRLSVLQAMKRVSGNESPRQARFQSTLVVGQIASSVALCVLAGLIGRTFLSLLPSEPGFAAESRTVLFLSLPPNLYPETRDRVQRLEEIVERVQGLPGVTAAGFGTNVPFGGDDGFRSVSNLDEDGSANDGSADDGSDQGGTAQVGIDLKADLRAISPNFFQLLQMPLVHGRIFTSFDGPAAPGVAIVNQSMARKLAPEGDVLGRSVEVRGSAALPRYQIVGVVADARSIGTSAEAWDEIYIPHAQSKGYYGYLIVRSQLDSATLNPMLREEVHAWAPERPDLPWQTATAMSTLMSRSLAGPRFSATLISAFSGMALLLAMIGVFGLVAYSVAQRFREFGIRAALGARPRDLLAATIRSAVILAAVGTSLGLAAAIYLTKFIESQLYGVEPLDVPTFVGAGAVMLIVAGFAAYLPARRAARVNPMTALRHE